MQDYNHLYLKGLGVSDEAYAKEFDIDESLVGTPEINRSFIEAQDDPVAEEKNIAFLYALCGLREEVKEYYRGDQ